MMVCLTERPAFTKLSDPLPRPLSRPLPSSRLAYLLPSSALVYFICSDFPPTPLDLLFLDCSAIMPTTTQACKCYSEGYDECLCRFCTKCGNFGHLRTDFHDQSLKQRNGGYRRHTSFYTDSNAALPTEGFESDSETEVLPTFFCFILAIATVLLLTLWGVVSIHRTFGR